MRGLAKVVWTERVEEEVREVGRVLGEAWGPPECSVTNGRDPSGHCVCCAVRGQKWRQRGWSGDS